MLRCLIDCPPLPLCRPKEGLHWMFVFIVVLCASSPWMWVAAAAACPVADPTKINVNGSMGILDLANCGSIGNGVVVIWNVVASCITPRVIQGGVINTTMIVIKVWNATNGGMGGADCPPSVTTSNPPITSTMTVTLQRITFYTPVVSLVVDPRVNVVFENCTFDALTSERNAFAKNYDETTAAQWISIQSMSDVLKLPLPEGGPVASLTLSNIRANMTCFGKCTFCRIVGSLAVTPGALDKLTLKSSHIFMGQYRGCNVSIVDGGFVSMSVLGSMPARVLIVQNNDMVLVSQLQSTAVLAKCLPVTVNVMSVTFTIQITFMTNVIAFSVVGSTLPNSTAATIAAPNWPMPSPLIDSSVRYQMFVTANTISGALSFLQYCGLLCRYTFAVDNNSTIAVNVTVVFVQIALQFNRVNVTLLSGQNVPLPTPALMSALWTASELTVTMGLAVLMTENVVNYSSSPLASTIDMQNITSDAPLMLHLRPPRCGELAVASVYINSNTFSLTRSRRNITNVQRSAVTAEQSQSTGCIRIELHPPTDAVSMTSYDVSIAFNTLIMHIMHNTSLNSTTAATGFFTNNTGIVHAAIALVGSDAASPVSLSFAPLDWRGVRGNVAISDNTISIDAEQYSMKASSTECTNGQSNMYAMMGGVVVATDAFPAGTSNALRAEFGSASLSITNNEITTSSTGASATFLMMNASGIVFLGTGCIPVERAALLDISWNTIYMTSVFADASMIGIDLAAPLRAWKDTLPIGYVVVVDRNTVSISRHVVAAQVTCPVAPMTGVHIFGIDLREWEGSWGVGIAGSNVRLPLMYLTRNTVALEVTQTVKNITFPTGMLTGIVVEHVVLWSPHATVVDSMVVVENATTCCVWAAWVNVTNNTVLHGSGAFEQFNGIRIQDIWIPPLRWTTSNSHATHPAVVVVNNNTVTSPPETEGKVLLGLFHSSWTGINVDRPCLATMALSEVLDLSSAALFDDLGRYRRGLDMSGNTVTMTGGVVRLHSVSMTGVDWGWIDAQAYVGCSVEYFYVSPTILTPMTVSLWGVLVVSNAPQRPSINCSSKDAYLNGSCTSIGIFDSAIETNVLNFWRRSRSTIVTADMSGLMLYVFDADGAPAHLSCDVALRCHRADEDQQIVVAGAVNGVQLTRTQESMSLWPPLIVTIGAAVMATDNSVTFNIAALPVAQRSFVFISSTVPSVIVTGLQFVSFTSTSIELGCPIVLERTMVTITAADAVVYGVQLRQWHGSLLYLANLFVTVVYSDDPLLFSEPVVSQTNPSATGLHLRDVENGTFVNMYFWMTPSKKVAVSSGIKFIANNPSTLLRMESVFVAIDSCRARDCYGIQYTPLRSLQLELSLTASSIFMTRTDVAADVPPTTLTAVSFAPNSVVIVMSVTHSFDVKDNVFIVRDVHSIFLTNTNYRTVRALSLYCLYAGPADSVVHVRNNTVMVNVTTQGTPVSLGYNVNGITVAYFTSSLSPSSSTTNNSSSVGLCVSNNRITIQSVATEPRRMLPPTTLLIAACIAFVSFMCEGALQAVNNTLMLDVELGNPSGNVSVIQFSRIVSVGNASTILVRGNELFAMTRPVYYTAAVYLERVTGPWSSITFNRNNITLPSCGQQGAAIAVSWSTLLPALFSIVSCTLVVTGVPDAMGSILALTAVVFTSSRVGGLSITASDMVMRSYAVSTNSSPSSAVRIYNSSFIGAVGILFDLDTRVQCIGRSNCFYMDSGSITSSLTVTGGTSIVVRADLDIPTRSSSNFAVAVFASQINVITLTARANISVLGSTNGLGCRVFHLSHTVIHLVHVSSSTMLSAQYGDAIAASMGPLGLYKLANANTLSIGYIIGISDAMLVFYGSNANAFVAAAAPQGYIVYAALCNNVTFRFVGGDQETVTSNAFAVLRTSLGVIRLSGCQDVHITFSRVQIELLPLVVPQSLAGGVDTTQMNIIWLAESSLLSCDVSDVDVRWGSSAGKEVDGVTLVNLIDADPSSAVMDMNYDSSSSTCPLRMSHVRVDLNNIPSPIAATLDRSFQLLTVGDMAPYGAVPNHFVLIPTCIAVVHVLIHYSSVPNTTYVAQRVHVHVNESTPLIINVLLQPAGTVPRYNTTTSSSLFFRCIVYDQRHVEWIPNLLPNDADVPVQFAGCATTSKFVSLSTTTSHTTMASLSYSPELLPTALPRKLVPSAVTKGIVTSAGAVGVAVSLFGGGGVVTAAMTTTRFKAYMALTGCEFDASEVLDFVTSPTQWCFGPAVGGCYRGGVLGNVLLLACVGVGVAVAGLLKVACNVNANSPSTVAETLGQGLMAVHLPSAMFIPFAVLIEGIALCSTATLTHASGSGDYVIAAVGLASMLAMQWYGWWVLTRFSCTLQPRQAEGASRVALPTPEKRGKALRTWWDKVFRSAEQWSPCRFKTLHMHLFNDYRVPYYPMVDWTVTMWIGVLEGLRLSGNRAACRVASSLVAALSLGLFAAGLWLRPALVPFETASLHAIGTAAAVTVVLMLVGNTTGSEAVQAAADVAALAGMCLNTIKMLVLLLSLVEWFSRHPLTLLMWWRSPVGAQTRGEAQRSALKASCMEGPSLNDTVLLDDDAVMLEDIECLPRSSVAEDMPIRMEDAGDDADKIAKTAAVGFDFLSDPDFQSHLLELGYRIH